ncbi:MAG TPA: hypothetical protein VGD07_17145 [Methylomirabilota bacterium]|jgi:hypothetical protein
MAAIPSILERSKRSIPSLRLAAAALVVLAICEIVILHLYVSAIRRSTGLSVELEYARGAAAIAYAQAERCSSPREPK